MAGLIFPPMELYAIKRQCELAEGTAFCDDVEYTGINFHFDAKNRACLFVTGNFPEDKLQDSDAIAFQQHLDRKFEELRDWRLLQEEKYHG